MEKTDNMLPEYDGDENNDFFSDPRELFNLLNSKGRVRSQKERDQETIKNKNVVQDEISRRTDKRDSL